MKYSAVSISLVLLIFTVQTAAQKNRRVRIIQKPATVRQPRFVTNTAIVVDERLAVLRAEPSLYALPVQRMRRGKVLTISGAKEADGVTFYRVAGNSPNNSGWVQSDAVIENFRSSDGERLARLIQFSEGFDQVERAMLFLENFPQSPLRPAMLLLTGDLIEQNAQKLSLEAAKKLDKKEMVASGAPISSFYLNFVSLDRYRKMEINFVFNPATKNFYYDGALWKEIIMKFPKASEVSEAQKRLAALTEKMAQTH